MISTKPRLAQELSEEFIAGGFGPFFGTPCGILAPLHSALEEQADLLTVTREDNAVAIAAGTALAGRFPVVLMQNSGLGQSVNVIASLITPYLIPLLLVVSLRGIHPDPTPENAVMGRLTEPLLSGLGIDTLVLNPHVHAAVQVGELCKIVRSNRGRAALLVSPTAFGWQA